MKLYHLLGIVVSLAIFCLIGAQLVTSRTAGPATELSIQRFEDSYGRVYVVVSPEPLNSNSAVAYVVIDHERDTVDTMFAEEFQDFPIYPRED